MNKFTKILFFGIAIALVSCVSKKKYNALGQYYQDIEHKLIKSQREVRILKRELAYKKAFSTDSIPITSIKFDVISHNFGKIKQESINNFTYTFTNSGTQPLVITNVKGSCGCTVPDWPKGVISPGESGKIKIVYSTGHQEGEQYKTITINANTTPENTHVFIKADVIP